MRLLCVMQLLLHLVELLELLVGDEHLRFPRNGGSCRLLQGGHLELRTDSGLLLRSTCLERVIPGLGMQLERRLQSSVLLRPLQILRCGICLPCMMLHPMLWND